MEKQIYSRTMHAAALLMAVTLLVHLFLGGPELYSTLRASDAAEDLKSVFSVIWHFVSLQLLLLTLALWQLARHRDDPLYWFVLVTVLGFGALFIGYGLNDLGSIWPMPQWIAFWGVGVLMLLGRFRS